MRKVIFLLLLGLITTSHASLTTDVVITDKGPVRGIILKSISNFTEYSAFKGIPYGKPPFSSFRFKPPIEVDSWTTIYDAFMDPIDCFQMGPDGPHGSENCLYLNVYTPKIRFNNDDDNEELRAVMVMIHGGTFLTGTINSAIYGPDFFMDENVIFVAMNYRLGAFGFMSLNHPNSTGNNGLKDQVLALKWVQKNIKNFGGDPHKVTIFGMSAGAVAVELHTISDASKGLFGGSIAMSGTPLVNWGFWSIQEAENQAFSVAKRLGLQTTDKDEILRYFYETSAIDLITAVGDFSEWNDAPVKPTYEDKNIATNEIFLSECAIRRYRSSDFKHLPHILGYTNTEGLGFTESMKVFKWFLRTSLKSTSKLSSPKLSFVNDFYRILINSGNSVNDISHELLYRAINISSDLSFVIGIDRAQQYLAQGSAPIYYYRNCFDYADSLHRLRGMNLNTTGHGDDFMQTFWLKTIRPSYDPNSDISIQRKKIVRMWTNFAKYRDPTPMGTADSLLNVTWTPSGLDGHFLDILNGQYTMRSRPINDIVKEVQEAFEKSDESSCDNSSIFATPSGGNCMGYHHRRYARKMKIYGSQHLERGDVPIHNQKNHKKRRIHALLCSAIKPRGYKFKSIN